MSFKRGDDLFCIKDSEDSVCAASDFQWLDTSDNGLVSTRPAAPKTAHYLANNPVECSNEGDDHINFDFGPFGLYASLASAQQFKLWSDFSHGEMSQQWPDTNYPLDNMSIGPSEEQGWVSPYNIYYYQDCASGNCSVTGMDETTVAAQTNIGDILINLHTKTQWAFDQKSINSVVGYDAKDMVGISVDPSISVSRAITNPPDGAIYICPETGCPDPE